MLYLKEANFEDIEKEYLFMLDMPADENGMTNPWHGMNRADFETIALKEMTDWSAGRNLPEGYVPESFFFLWMEDEIIGHFRIRHFLNEALRTGAGHIGCFIHPKYRGRGYGSEGLRLTLEKARCIVPEDEVYLRVNQSNVPSLRAMMKNGGRIAGQDAEKYYVRIPK